MENNLYVTRINAGKLSPEDFQKLIEVCEFCKHHDKHANFNYQVHGRIIRITSPDEKTAKKRGYYLKKKFGLYFNIIKEE